MAHFLYICCQSPTAIKYSPPLGWTSIFLYDIRAVLIYSGQVNENRLHYIDFYEYFLCIKEVNSYHIGITFWVAVTIIMTVANEN